MVHPIYAPILYRHAPQQTEKLWREIQNPQIVQQTISPNAKRSTLGVSRGRRVVPKDERS
jgi:hypothetical protein